VVTLAREFLLSALRRITGGGEITNDELLHAVPDLTELDEVEQSAWFRLSHWADDGDIRAKDQSYADMQQQQIAFALTDLEAVEAGHLPSEVARGEHQASHLGKWGCLTLMCTVVAACCLVALLV
jgi:hypothetical protein